MSKFSKILRVSMAFVLAVGLCPLMPYQAQAQEGATGGKGLQAANLTALEGGYDISQVTSYSQNMFASTGSTIEPDFKLYIDDTLLQKGVDYSIEKYLSSDGNVEVDPIQPGYYKAVLRGIAPSYNSYEVYFRIYDRYDISVVSQASIGRSWYTGSVVEPNFSISRWDGDTLVTLELGKQFRIERTERFDSSTGSYIEEQPIAVGDYRAYCVGIAPYYGSYEVGFSISDPQSIANASVSFPDTLFATGDPLSVRCEVRVYSNLLYENSDYEILGFSKADEDWNWYPVDDVVEPGRYQIHLKGLGAYGGERTASFTVWDNRDVGAADVNTLYSIYDNDPSINPVRSVTLDGCVLRMGDDYTVSYRNAETGETFDYPSIPAVAGTYTVTVTGVSPYYGSKYKNVTIMSSHDLANANVRVIENTLLYPGSSVTPNLQVLMNGTPLKQGDDYVLSYETTDGEPVDAITQTGTFRAVLQGAPGSAYENTSVSRLFDVRGAYNIESSRVKFANSEMVHTGSVLDPGIVVIAPDGSTLEKDIDYELSYTRYDTDEPAELCDVGSYIAHVTGKDPWFGSRQTYLSILDPKDIANASCTLPYRRPWTGNIDDDLACDIVLNGKQLVAGVDYTMSFQVSPYGDSSEPTPPGTYTVLFTASGEECTGSFERTIKLYEGIDLGSTAVSVSYYNSYKGSPVKPDIVAKLDGVTLVEGRDYTLSYSRQNAFDDVSSTPPTKCGNYNARLTGINGVTGTTSVPFAIVDGADLSYARLSGLESEYARTGQPVKPSPTVIALDGTVLSEGQDYLLAWCPAVASETSGDANCIEEGLYMVKVYGIGSYSGQSSARYRIVPGPGSPDFISVTGMRSSYEYTGSPIELGYTALKGDRELVENVDYVATVMYIRPQGEMQLNSLNDVVAPGAYKLYMNFLCTNYRSMQSFDFEVTEGSRIDLSSAEVSVPDQTYTGQELRPPATVKLDGKTLVAGEDYELSYSDNVDVGVASVTATGKRNYTGSASGTFQIVSPEPGVYGTTIPELVRAVTDAQAAYDAALSGVQPYQDALDQAQAALASAEADYSAALEDVSAKQSAVDEASGAVTSASSELAAAESALQSAQSDLAAAQSAKTQAQGALTSARAGKDAADAEVATAQQALDQAQVVYDSADEQISKGSFGFFESVGATGALDALNRTGYNDNVSSSYGGGTFTGYTHQGEETDATSLDNMKKAIEWIREGNELRIADDIFTGCAELKVSDTLMAMAQSNTNFSAVNVGVHASKAGSDYNVGENIAYGYPVHNPYDMWYDDEKLVYRELQANQDLNGDGKIGDGRGNVTGHYTNIVNSSYKATGFAVCSENYSYPLTWGQTFFFGAKAGEQLYTVDEYEARFMAYYRQWKEEPEANLAAAQQAYDAAVAAQEAAQQAVDAAHADLTAAQSAVDTAQTAVNLAVVERAAKQAAYDSALGAKQQAEADLEDAQQVLSQKSGEKTAAQQAVESAQQDLDEAMGAIGPQSEALQDAQQRLEGATDLSEATVVASPESFVYNGSEQVPAVSVTIPVPDRDTSNTFAAPSDDIAVTYAKGGVEEASPTDAGEYTATLAPGDSDTGIEGTSARFHGQAGFAFTIDKADVSGAEVLAQDATYNGAEQHPELVVTLQGRALQPGDYEVVGYGNAVNAGEATVTVRGKGNYAGTASGTFEVAPRDIAGASVSAGSVVYSGAPATPRPTVTLDGAALKEGVDYEVSGYSGNGAAGTATVTVRGKGNYSGTASGTFQIVDKLVWKRVSGADRYGTMQAIARAGFEKSDVAVVATGVNFPDALAASALAGAYDAPVILTNGKASALSGQASREIERLGVRKVFIMGGELAVGEGVERDIKSRGIEVSRVAGGERIQTSVEAYKKVKEAGKSCDTVILAKSQDFPDTLSIGPFSYATSSPILLVAGNSMAREVEAAVADAGRVVIVGGTLAVSQSIENRARRLCKGEVVRVHGGNRYQTSAEVAKWEVAQGMTCASPSVATGKNFPDALAGAPFAGSQNSVLLLANSPSDPTVSYLESVGEGIGAGYFIGGPSAVSDALAKDIAKRTGGEFEE